MIAVFCILTIPTVAFEDMVGDVAILFTPGSWFDSEMFIDIWLMSSSMTGGYAGCDGAPRPIIMPCHPRHLCDLVRLGYPLLGVYSPSRLALSLLVL